MTAGMEHSLKKNQPKKNNETENALHLHPKQGKMPE